MASTGVLAAKQLEALGEIRSVLDEHAAPEQAQRLRVLGPEGRIPNSVKSPVEFDTFVAEALAILVGLYDEQAKALAPKPRGRPRKAS